MLLDQLLDEIKATRGPIDLAGLSRRLGTQVSAIQGMLDLLEWKGVIERPRAPIGDGQAVCSAPCGTACTGMESCAFALNLGASQPVRFRETPR